MIDGDRRNHINELIEAQRAVCLWYLRSDYFPTTDVERVRVLDAIQKYGDLEAFRRAGEFKQWLLRHSSEVSVGS